MIEHIPKSWISNDQFGATRMFMYSSNFETFEKDLVSTLFAAARSLCSVPAIIFAGSDIEKKSETIKIAVVYDKGTATIHNQVIKEIIPKSDFLIIASPLKKRGNENEFVEQEAIEAAFTIRGFLCSVLGCSVAHTEMGHSDYIHGTDQDTIVSSNVVQNHVGFSDSAHLDPTSLSKFHSLIAKCQSEETKRRGELAFSFVGRGQREAEHKLRFFDYWTALEIFHGGSKKLRRHIDTARAFPLYRSRMLELKDKRDKMIHHGEDPQFDGEEERFLAMSLTNSLLIELGHTDLNLESLFAKKEPK